MSFIIKQDEAELSLDPDFAPVAKRLADLQTSYDTAKQSAQITRMEMIGLAEKHKALYPQRSPEARFINQGYSDNGWSQQTVYNNKAAFIFKQTLLDKHVDVYTELAEACSPSQLLELSRTEGKRSTTVYHAAMHLRKTGKVPTVSQIRGHLQGNTTDQFKFFSTIRAEKKRLEESEIKVNFELNPQSESSADFELTPDTQTSGDTSLRKDVPVFERGEFNKPELSLEQFKEQVEEQDKEQVSELELNSKPSFSSPAQEEPTSSSTSTQIVDVDALDVSIESEVATDLSSPATAKQFYKLCEEFAFKASQNQLTPDEKVVIRRGLEVVARFYKINDLDLNSRR